MKKIDLSIIHRLFPATSGNFTHKVVGVSECLFGANEYNAHMLHAQFKSHLVESEYNGNSYIIPANGETLEMLVEKIIDAGFDVINFAVRKERDGKAIDYIYPDYEIEELWQEV